MPRSVPGLKFKFVGTLVLLALSQAPLTHAQEDSQKIAVAPTPAPLETLAQLNSGEISETARLTLDSLLKEHRAVSGEEVVFKLLTPDTVPSAADSESTELGTEDNTGQDRRILAVFSNKSKTGTPPSLDWEVGLRLDDIFPFESQAQLSRYFYSVFKNSGSLETSTMATAFALLDALHSPLIPSGRAALVLKPWEGAIAQAQTPKGVAQSRFWFWFWLGTGGLMVAWSLERLMWREALITADGIRPVSALQTALADLRELRKKTDTASLHAWGN